MKATRMMVLTAALLVAACGGDSDGGTGPGNGGTPGFSADVTGDLQTSFGGNAGYGVVDEEGGKVFAVEMENDQTGGADPALLVAARCRAAPSSPTGSTATRRTATGWRWRTTPTRARSPRSSRRGAGR